VGLLSHYDYFTGGIIVYIIKTVSGLEHMLSCPVVQVCLQAKGTLLQPGQTLMDL